ncbi:Thioredoxin-like fold [Pseudocohnilembus persalinus]|uniref:Thioredoxin-like fold n=1 Tax=Pseudocohnilembus persalinus TaxID=266149 RepID=A0A0V0QTW4_PSEPJ|nr:Thioredoxin-like fold [Pseudocohnilembus persalinus]|eukprot:KRX05654.1 Thioredoxin-like fold [Pseudocohnilembus persalinus]
MNKIILFLVLAMVLINARELYDHNKSYITPITNFNFGQQINKIRETTNQVSIVHYYKSGDEFSEQFAPEFDKWVTENKGLFRVGAIDCNESASICEKEKITTFPTFRIYPPTPHPVIDITENISVKNIQQKAGKELVSKVIEITNTNIEAFLSENPSVPKVLLFTNAQKGIPLMYRGLSVQFEGKQQYGLVRSSDDILVSRYRIKDFPSIILIRNGEKKWETYSGEIKFDNIFKWLNIYSQTFVPGGGESQSNASKEWLTEIVPELHQKSSNDICLKTENTLCVIHIGKGKPEKSVIDTFKSLNSAYDRKIDRGSKYKFMWLDAEIEKEYAETFGFEGQDLIVILNPGKRKRYVKHEGDFQYDTLKTTMEKIQGGDARFTKVTLPSQLAFRK